jgi:hypothetical protein
VSQRKKWKAQVGRRPRAEEGPGRKKAQSGRRPRAEEGPGRRKAQGEGRPRAEEGPGRKKAQGEGRPRAKEGPGRKKAQGEGRPRAEEGPGRRKAQGVGGPPVQLVFKLIKKENRGLKEILRHNIAGFKTTREQLPDSLSDRSGGRGKDYVGPVRREARGQRWDGAMDCEIGMEYHFAYD